MSSRRRTGGGRRGSAGVDELGVAGVEGDVAVEGEAAGVEDDTVLGEHRRAETGVGHVETGLESVMKSG